MDHSPFNHRHKLGSCYATWFIRRKANELAGNYGFSGSEREDLAQELRMHLIRSWPSFDPAKGKPTTYIQRLVMSRVRELLRERRRQKRPLWEEHPGYEQSIFDQGLLNGVQGQPEISDFERIDLRLDVETILAGLPLELRWIATQLQHDSPETVAARMGIPKTTLCRRMLEIRERFEAAGYGLNDLAAVLCQKECA